MKIKRQRLDPDETPVDTKEIVDPGTELTSAPIVPSTDVRRRTYIDIEPKNSIDHDGNVWFNVERSSEAFTDMRNFEVTAVISITRKDGTPMTGKAKYKEETDPQDNKKKIKRKIEEADDDNITICSSILYALFSRCTVAINDQPIGPASHYFPQIYDANMELSTSLMTKNTYVDATTIWSRMSAYDNKTNLLVRQKFIEGSRHLTVTGRLHHSLFNCKRYLPPNTLITVNLERSSDSLPLIRITGSVDYKINLHQCTLTVPRVYLTEGKHNEVIRDIHTRNAVYEYIDTYVNVFQASAGTSLFRIKDINFARVPRRAMVVFCDVADLTGGDVRKAPFVYMPYAMESMNVHVNDVSVFQRPLKTNAPYPDDMRYQKFYTELYKTLDADDKRSDFTLSYERFVTDRAFFPIDFARYIPAHVGTTANISIEITFSAPILTSIGCMVFSESMNGFTLDRDNNIELFHL